MVIEQIKNEIKDAMVNKDEVRKNTLKQVLDKANASAKEASLKNGTDIKVELTDEVCINAVNKEIKQLDQTISMLEQGKKTESDLYKNSVKAKEILSAYLPKQLNVEELEEEIKKLIADIDTSNRGLVMKTVMGALKGKADGKLINQTVSKLIS